MEVSIPSKLHNSLIGAKGRFIRSIMEECGGVHIHFPTEGSGSDTVTIRGPAQDVEKAKKQLLQLAEEKVRIVIGGRKLCEPHSSLNSYLWIVFKCMGTWRTCDLLGSAADLRPDQNLFGLSEDTGLQ